MTSPEAFSFAHQSESAIEKDSSARARIIAASGDYREIESQLTSENLLADEMLRVKAEYQEFLQSIEFLTEQDLKIFTILELYDKDLALHSLETYRIAKEKIEKELDFNVKIIDLIAKENVTPEQFFRACLLHDIGKVEIPNFILNNPIHNKEMEMLLRDLVVDKEDSQVINKLSEVSGTFLNIHDEEELENFLSEHNLRSVHFVPVKYILTPEEQAILEKQNFDLNSSLMDIIKIHEQKSQNILEEAGLITESMLAGSHHNYHGKGSPYPFSVEALSLSVDMAELIRIADMTEALTASRSYNKKGFSLPRVLKIILEEVRVGRIKPEMAYLWINDDLKMLENQAENVYSPSDLEDIQIVKNQLAEIRQTIDDSVFYHSAAA